MVEPGRIFPVSSDWPFETWEVAVTPLPLWLPVEGRRARAWLAVCLNADTDKALSSEPGGEEEIPQMLEQVLTRAGQRWRSRPARVRVADAEVARMLEDLLEPREVAVEVVARLAQLPEMVDALIAGMAPPDPRPGPLTGEGVTVEPLRSFARAAADFYASSGWRHLSPEDLIQVEAPEVEESLRYFILTRQAYGPAGLWFLSETDDLETLLAGAIKRMASGHGFWTLGFDQPWTAPPEDVDLWERHGLPWAGEDRCPIVYRAGLEAVERPNARQLAFFEGLLAALAATAEEDLDTGRWEKQVSTAEGPVRFVLSLPGLWDDEEDLDDDFDMDFDVHWITTDQSMAGLSKLLGRDLKSIEEANEVFADMLRRGRSVSQAEPAEPETPRDKAEALVDEAYDARGRRAVLLARQALEAWPDCAEAYSLLASRAFETEAALDLYAQAMAAAERAMGPGVFSEEAEEAGSFWEIPETQPYMGARLGYAETLVKLGRLEEAAEHFQEMLRLNPKDTQGVREALVNVLTALDRDEEAQALLDRFREDDSTLMGFPRALLRFRREGDSTEARRCLKHALRANRFVPGLLLRTRQMPAPVPIYSPGTEGEAAIYFALSHETWEKTPGALDWLRERTVTTTVRAVRSKARSKARGKKKKKRR